MIEGLSILTEHPDLLIYVDSLQRKNAEALSFYPKCVFEREQEKGRIFLALLNGMPCGYIYVGAPPLLKCHQVCIEYDLRRRLYGAALVAHMEKHAENVGAISITLRCGFDLDANNFWKSMGYRCIAIVEGGIRRKRKINVWQKELSKSLIPYEEMKPAVGVIDASTWRKNKQTGIINQFARGNKLAYYRQLIDKDKEAT